MYQNGSRNTLNINRSDIIEVEGRPIYVWTKPHIEGHFLTCYLALTIYRLLQLKLENKYTVSLIKEDLAKASIIPLEQDIFITINKREVFKELIKDSNDLLLNDYLRLETLRIELKTIIK